MIEAFLAKALRKHLERVCQNSLLPTKKGELRLPQVLNGYLPPKRADKEDDFPFVIVRPVSGSSDSNSSSAAMVIVIGCYSTGEDKEKKVHELYGHEYCLELMDRIRMSLMSLPDLVLDGRYLLQDGIEWQLFESADGYPYWQVEMTTHWVFYSPASAFKEY